MIFWLLWYLLIWSDEEKRFWCWSKNCKLQSRWYRRACG